VLPYSSGRICRCRRQSSPERSSGDPASTEEVGSLTGVIEANTTVEVDW
jgi:hypothetical protein